MPDPMHTNDNYEDKIEEMYPEVYRKMMPHVDEVISSANTYDLTEDDLNRMTYQVIMNSNMSADPPRGHNENTVGDVARALILTGLFNQAGYDDGYYPYAYPYYPPVYMFPFGGIFGNRGRRGGFRGGHPHMGRR